MRSQWSTESLELAIEGLDQGYKIFEVCEKYNIPRSSLRDHFLGKSRGRKMGPKTVLSAQEEEKVCDYINLMVNWGHPMTPLQLKNKVAEITQDRITPFKNGQPGKSWVKWFRIRHPHLVLRMPQGLDHKRARALCPENAAKFYSNLEVLYLEHKYPENCIWNVDESGYQANQNGLGKVFAKRGVRGIHQILPSEREWLSVLSAVNANGECIPNYYIFKGIRKIKNYVALCEEGAMMGMQKKGWMDTIHFMEWMDHFIHKMESEGRLSQEQRHLLILDGHKSHISMDVLLKAKEHHIDMISLPSHTSHHLQPLDIACFRPFKVPFRAYRDLWNIQNSGKKCKKEDLAQWASLALQRALTKKISKVVLGVVEFGH